MSYGVSTGFIVTGVTPTTVSSEVAVAKEAGGTNCLSISRWN